MSYLHLCTNVGSLGSESHGDSPDTVSTVRRNLYEVIDRVKVEHGQAPNSVGLQEVRTFGMNLAPHFSTPLATDALVYVEGKYGRNAARGVATYANPGTTEVFPALDTTAEIVLFTAQS